MPHLDARRLAATAATLAGTASWSAYQGRLLLRALHMLQLEQYQTARFLAWSARRRDRWAAAPGLAAGIGTVALGGTDLLAGTRLTASPPTPPPPRRPGSRFGCLHPARRS